MVLRPLLLNSLLLSLTCATSISLTGYSTTTHFTCAGISCPPQTAPLPSTALPALLGRLSTSSAVASADLPLRRDAPTGPASLTLVVRSAVTAKPANTLSALHDAVGGDGSSFIARAEDVTFADESHNVADIEALKVKQGVATVTVGVAEVPRMMAALKKLAGEVDGGLAVVWAAREDEQVVAAAEAKEAAPEAEAAAAAEPATGDTVEAGKVEPDVPPAIDPKAETGYLMYPPEISEAGVAGLLVTFVFLMIFVPGFMCLWRIQPPQKFGSMDGNDARKKMQ